MRTRHTLVLISARIPGLVDVRRTRELSLRWVELNAFGPVFRLHEGYDSSGGYELLADGEEADLAHLARFGQVFAAFKPYRRRLLDEAAGLGWPVMRPMFVRFPDDPAARGLDDQFMLGHGVLVAPVLEPGQRSRKLYVPAGAWTDLWTGRTERSTGEWWTVSAPIGRPPVFLDASDPLLERIRKDLPSP